MHGVEGQESRDEAAADFFACGHVRHGCDAFWLRTARFKSCPTCARAEDVYSSPADDRRQPRAQGMGGRAGTDDGGEGFLDDVLDGVVGAEDAACEGADEALVGEGVVGREGGDRHVGSEEESHSRPDSVTRRLAGGGAADERLDRVL